MARSRRSSCFKILTCGGGDSIHEEDDDGSKPTKVKGSGNSLCWNFRKRSTRHQVLSNTLISENPSSGEKESPKATSIEFHLQRDLGAPQKNSVSQWMEEKSPSTISVYSKVDSALVAEDCAGKSIPLVSTETAEKINSLTTSESRSKISQNLQESSVIVIQASVRRYLAQKNHLKLKHIVKLQAAFRGHLERRQAAGTLRCVQAIVKMQALVRASQAHASKQLLATEEQITGNNEKAIQSQVTLEKEQSGSKANTLYSSREKLLSNGFTRHLLESAPKKNPIQIKCDPLKPDSAWKWLERWVSVSSAAEQAQKPGTRYLEGEEVARASEVETGFLDEVVCNSMGLEQNVRDIASPDEYEENLITYDADNFKFQACHPSSSATGDVVNVPQFDDVDFGITQSISSTNNSSQLRMQLDADKKVSVSTSKMPEAGNEQLTASLERVSHEQPETDGEKTLVGLRKACNPAFAAVQSKFEELSTSGISGRSNSFQIVGAETRFDVVSSTTESETRKKEHDVAENLTSHEPKALDGGSKCETGRFISSSLDLPMRSEVGAVEYEQETKTMEKNTSEPHSTIENGWPKDQDLEANKSSDTSESNVCLTLSQQDLENVKGVSIEVVFSVNSAPLEQSSGRNLPDIGIQMETPPDKKGYRLSPDVSPKSHMTVQKAYGTPSSQISVKDRMNKVDKSGSSQSRRSLSADKRSPSNSKLDSVASSTEKQTRDSKSGKRRNSFGTSRLDHVDLDPRDASSNSLPSYMQATESARAKALANISPRSITNFQDKEIYVKKRYSLPGANGKQVSPRMQRSLSQAQQGAKESVAHDQDRKWQR